MKALEIWKEVGDLVSSCRGWWDQWGRRQRCVPVGCVECRVCVAAGHSAVPSGEGGWAGEPGDSATLRGISHLFISLPIAITQMQ